MTDQPTHPTFVLCLSGGGLRATFFHLGIIRFLFEADYLSRIKVLSCVSGGSVMGAHFIKNWARYTDPKQFEAAADELVRFSQIDARGRAIRRTPLLLLNPLLCFGKLRRFRKNNTNLLIREYRDLLNGHDEDADLLTALYESSHSLPPPELLIHASCLNSGEIFSFNPRGLTVLKEGADYAEHETPVHHYDSARIRLSNCVGASSAFPLLFSPLDLNESSFSLDVSELKQRGHYDVSLTDGGVYDNLGLKGARHADRFPEASHILVSNAGAAFEWQTKKDLRGLPVVQLIKRVIRSSDIMARRIRELEIQQMRSNPMSGHGKQIIELNIEQRIPNQPSAKGSFDQNGISTNQQWELRNVRTDLDCFDPIVIAALIKHGYCVARTSLLAARLPVPEAASNSTPWVPERFKRLDEKTVESRKIRILHRHSKRRWRIFSRRDWLGKAYFFLMVVAILGVSVAFAHRRYTIVIVDREPVLLHKIRNTFPRPLIAGTWFYQITSGPNYHHEGTALIAQKGEHFHISGTRTNTFFFDGMNWTNDSHTFRWETVTTHYTDTNEIYFTYQAIETNLHGFCTARFTSVPGAAVKEMKGEYFRYTPTPLGGTIFLKRIETATAQ